MDLSKFVTSRVEMLLAGPSLANPRADTEGVGIDDIIISNMPAFEGRMRKTGSPKVNFVRGNKVRANYLAWADYGNGHIDIAAFDEIMENVKGPMKQKYGQVRDALHRYILNHEQHELEYMPQNHIEHGSMEARNMIELEFSDPDAYLTGLALHKERLGKGSRDEKAFSKATSRHYDLGKAFERYGAGLDEMVGLVSDVITGKPTYQHKSGMTAYTFDHSRQSAVAAPGKIYKLEDYRPAMSVDVAEAA